MDPEKKQFAWWYYFWLLVVFAVLSPLLFEGLEDWLYWLVSLVPLAGLWGYLKRRPLGHRYFWAAYFVLSILNIAYGVVLLAQLPSDWRMASAAAFVVCYVLAFPLLLALWRYSFRSPGIWRTSAGAA
jgi:hypothetical protein